MSKNKTRATAVVVNDDPTQLNILAGLLQKAGIVPSAFERAEAALAAMDPADPPGLIVTDLYMPGIDGWRFCRLLRSPEYAAFNDIPILVVSATFAGDHPERIAADLGADAFLPSPVDGKEFTAQARALLAGKEARRLSRALIVEDGKTLAGLLKKAFAAHGYRADTALSVAEATAAFAKTAYDVAVLDYHLPDGAGDALLDAFRAGRPDCVCLMMTTDPTPELALDWMKRGAAAYLRKPFEPEYLIELCARARRERALLRAEDLLEARTRELRESEAAVRNKLKAILEPQSDLGDLELADIVDVPAVQSLLENFHRITGMASAIVDHSGKVLVGVGWQDICTRFHRRHPETLQYCLESDTLLAGGAKAGEFKAYRCKNGMWDMASPIEVAGRHMGNIYFGQFLYTDEEPDVERFRDQARRHGFDETEYLAALGRVPRYDRETVRDVMDFYSRLGLMISSLSFSAISLSRTLTARKRAEEALWRNNKDLRESQRISHVGSWRLDVATNQVVWTEELYNMYGFDPSVPPPPYTEHMKLFTPESWERLSTTLARTRETGIPYTLELETVRKDGSNGWMWVRGEADVDSTGKTVGLWGAAQDITERKRAEEKLKTSEAMMAASQRIGHVGSWVLDLASNQLTWSDEAYRIFGIEPQAFGATYEAFLERVHPDDRQAVDAAYTASLRERRDAYEIEHRIVRLDTGEVRHVHERSHHEYDAAGAVLRSVGMVQDITERKRAEEALRESEAKYRDLVESSQDAIFSVDRNGFYQFANSNFASTLGHTPEYFDGKSFWDIYPKDLADMRHEGVLKVFETGQPSEVEVVVPVPDRTLYYLAKANPVKDTHGNIIQVLVTATDITVRKQAEEALQASEETHRALVAGLPDTVMRFDRAGRHLFVSENVRQTVNLEAAQFIGKTHAELGFPEAQCRFWEESIRRVFDGGEPFETEFTYEGKTGTVIFDWRLVPERDARDAVSSVLLISRDITAHKRLERDYRALFAAMLDGFAVHEIICDDAGRPCDYRFLDINPAFERMTGLGREIIGKTVLEVLPGTEPHWIEAYGRVALTGEPAHFENVSAGIGKWFEVTAFRNAPGQFACAFVDITPRKRAEEYKEKLQAQLVQAQKMESVGRLAGGVAHDFNNMLGVILGHTELALERVDPAQPLFADLQEVRTAAERSADLTRQLLAFARKQTVAPKVIDLNKTVSDMLKMLQRLIGEDIDLAWLLGKALGPVNVDPSQIDQILANLCVNARDAIEGVGKVTIETGAAAFDEAYCAAHAGFVPGDYVLLAVSDNGCGMDSETLGHLFEPFFTTKELGHGTGLGLAMVYGAVKQNNGFINVYSEPGQGTTFKIYLPRHLAKADRPAEKKPDQPAGRGHETILLVEDEPAILRMTTMMLERMGYAVMGASTPGEAIRLANEHAGGIHLLMTDVVMPEMNGRDLAGNILSLYPGIKRLFMSGYTANVIAHHGVLDEGVNFIQKPFSMKDLAAKVREVLG